MKKSTPYRKRGGLQHVGIERRTLREEYLRELRGSPLRELPR
jgi:hypothetical protein